MKFKVVSPCINQDSGKKLKPGDFVENLSDFDRGRHLAEGNIVPVDDRRVERAVKKPAESRRRRRSAGKKVDSDGTD